MVECGIASIHKVHYTAFEKKVKFFFHLFFNSFLACIYMQEPCQQLYMQLSCHISTPPLLRCIASEINSSATQVYS